MKKQYYAIALICFLLGVLACNSNSTEKKDIPKEEESVQKTDSSFVQKKSKYEGLLKKFKPISFDTLKIEYYYDTKDKRYVGTELTLNEAKSFPLGLTEKEYYAKLSGVYACYQFPIDSSRIGLIARIPAEYEATSVGFFIFDRKTDKIQKEYFHLSASYGDAGDAYTRISWLFRTKKNQLQSFVYDYSSYNHEVEDTADHTIDEWRTYFLIDYMSSKFDTLSKNEIQLKKRFKNLLKTEE